MQGIPRSNSLDEEITWAKQLARLSALQERIANISSNRQESYETKGIPGPSASPPAPAPAPAAASRKGKAAAHVAVGRAQSDGHVRPAAQDQHRVPAQAAASVGGEAPPRPVSGEQQQVEAATCEAEDAGASHFEVSAATAHLRAALETAASGGVTDVCGGGATTAAPTRIERSACPTPTKARGAAANANGASHRARGPAQRGHGVSSEGSRSSDFEPSAPSGFSVGPQASTGSREKPPLRTASQVMASRSIRGTPKRPSSASKAGRQEATIPGQGFWSTTAGSSGGATGSGARAPSASRIRPSSAGAARKPFAGPSSQGASRPARPQRPASAGVRRSQTPDTSGSVQGSRWASPAPRASPDPAPSQEQPGGHATPPAAACESPSRFEMASTFSSTPSLLIPDEEVRHTESTAPACEMEDPLLASPGKPGASQGETAAKTAADFIGEAEASPAQPPKPPRPGDGKRGSADGSPTAAMSTDEELADEEMSAEVLDVHRFLQSSGLEELTEVLTCATGGGGVDALLALPDSRLRLLGLTRTQMQRLARALAVERASRSFARDARWQDIIDSVDSSTSRQATLPRHAAARAARARQAAASPFASSRPTTPSNGAPVGAAAFVPAATDSGGTPRVAGGTTPRNFGVSGSSICGGPSVQQRPSSASRSRPSSAQGQRPPVASSSSSSSGHPAASGAEEASVDAEQSVMDEQAESERSRTRQARIREFLQRLEVGPSPMDVSRVTARQQQAQQRHMQRSPSPASSSSRIRPSRSLMDLISDATASRWVRPDPVPPRCHPELMRALMSVPATAEQCGEQCTICLAKPRTSEFVTSLPCGHWYHRECIREWLGHSRICPLCKGSAVPKGVHIPDE